MKKNLIRVIALLTAGTMAVLSAGCGGSAKQEVKEPVSAPGDYEFEILEPEPIDFTIEGLEEKIVAPAGDELKKNIVISPEADITKVELQVKEEDGEYHTVGVFEEGDSEDPDESDADGEDPDEESGQPDADDEDPDEDESSDSNAQSAAEDSVSFTLDFPSEFRQQIKTSWRLLIPETDSTAEYTRDFELISTDIGNLEIHAPIYCIYDPESDEILAGRSAKKRTSMASITKIMSAVVFLEEGDMEKTTSLSADAVAVNRQEMVLKEGDTFKNSDLFTALMIESSNSAGVALGDSAAGSEAGFVDLMNQKAVELGLIDTHFQNPHGLDASGHYSTAEEVSKLTEYAFGFDQFAKVVHTPKAEISPIDSDRKIPLTTTDLLVAEKEDLPDDAPEWLTSFSDEGFQGGKTGFTLGAGYAFTGRYEYQGKNYIVTEIGAADEYTRWKDVISLIDYIKKNA